MRRTLLALSMMVLATGSAFAQVDIVGYSFEGLTGGGTTAPTFVDGTLVTSATNITNIGGTSALAAGGQASFLPAFPNSQNNSFRITDFSNGTTRFSFTFTVGAFPISLQTYSFDATTDGSTVAPTSWALFVNGILADTGVTANHTLNATPQLPLYAGAFSGFNGLSGNVTVDLFAFTGDANGTWRLDNFTMSAVPEPATYALLGISGMAAGAYTWMRRRNLNKSLQGKLSQV